MMSQIKKRESWYDRYLFYNGIKYRDLYLIRLLKTGAVFRGEEKETGKRLVIKIQLHKYEIKKKRWEGWIYYVKEEMRYRKKKMRRNWWIELLPGGMHICAPGMGFYHQKFKGKVLVSYEDEESENVGA